MRSLPESIRKRADFKWSHLSKCRTCTAIKVREGLAGALSRANPSNEFLVNKKALELKNMKDIYGGILIPHPTDTPPQGPPADTPPKCPPSSSGSLVKKKALELKDIYGIVIPDKGAITKSVPYLGDTDTVKIKTEKPKIIPVQGFSDPENVARLKRARLIKAHRLERLYADDQPAEDRGWGDWFLLKDRNPEIKLDEFPGKRKEKEVILPIKAGETWSTAIDVDNFVVRSSVGIVPISEWTPSPSIRLGIEIESQGGKDTQYVSQPIGSASNPIDLTYINNNINNLSITNPNPNRGHNVPWYFWLKGGHNVPREFWYNDTISPIWGNTGANWPTANFALRYKLNPEEILNNPLTIIFPRSYKLPIYGNMFRGLDLRTFNLGSIWPEYLDTGVDAVDKNGSRYLSPAVEIGLPEFKVTTFPAILKQTIPYSAQSTPMLYNIINKTGVVYCRDTLQQSIMLETLSELRLRKFLNFLATNRKDGLFKKWNPQLLDHYISINEINKYYKRAFYRYASGGILDLNMITPFRLNFNQFFPTHIERNPDKLSDKFNMDRVALGVACYHRQPPSCYHVLVEDIRINKELVESWEKDKTNQTLKNRINNALERILTRMNNVERYFTNWDTHNQPHC